MIFSQNQRICIKLKHMLSGNTLQFYDQIGSNMEEQQMKQQMAKEYRNTEEREREQLQTCNLSQEEEM